MTVTHTPIETFRWQDLPHLEWALGISVDPDSLDTTTITISSGTAPKHTAIYMCADQIDPSKYHVLWWRYRLGRDEFRHFSVTKGQYQDGYGFLRVVLEIVEGYEKEGKVIVP